MFKNAYIDTVTDVTAYDTSLANNGAGATLGELRSHYHPTYGWQRYRYVLNTSGATIAKGSTSQYVVAVADNYHNVIVGAADTPRLNVAGFPQVDLPNNYFGWVLEDGIGELLAGAAIAIDKYVFSLGATGRMDDLAAAPANFAEHVKTLAKSMQAAAANGDLFLARVLISRC